MQLVGLRILVLPTRDQEWNLGSTVQVQSLNHWATMEFPQIPSQYGIPIHKENAAISVII